MAAWHVGSIPFTKEDVKKHLDDAIIYWRKVRDDLGDRNARYYIDAFQCIRMSIFDCMLDADNVHDYPSECDK